MTDQDRARMLRRRHVHERQAVVFGVLIAGLGVAGLGAAAMYTDNLSLPFFERGFSAAPTETAVAVATYCPPEGALPVPHDQITVDVFNGAGTAGLARQTAAALGALGFVVGETDNAPSVTGTGRIVYGPAGSAAAYTLQAYVPGAVLSFADREDASVDLIVGSEFQGLLPAEQVLVDPSAPLVGPDGCTPFSALTASDADQATEGEQPADGEQPVEGEQPADGEQPAEGEQPAG